MVVMSDLSEQDEVVEPESADDNSSVGSADEAHSDGSGAVDNPSTLFFNESDGSFSADPIGGSSENPVHEHEDGAIHSHDPVPIGDEHPDGIVGPERPMPEDEARDVDATPDNLAEADVNLMDPGPAHVPVDFTVSISDHQVSVDISGQVAHESESELTIQDISDEDLQRVQRIAAEDSSRRAMAKPRPFEGVDLESLLLLRNQITAEIASR